MENKEKICNSVLCVIASTTLIYLVWRLGFTIPKNGIAGIFFFILEVISIIIIWLQLLLIKRVKTGENYSAQTNNTFAYPEIDVYIMNRNNNQRETYNTINACLLVDYPDKNKVHIIPVDGDAEELNATIKKSNSPLIAVIEAGMIPRHEFLMEMVDVFLSKHENDKIGFVQCFQGSFNPDAYQFRLFSQGLVPSKNKFFYKCQQPVFEEDNSVVYCGSGAVFSREALEEIGGFDTKCSRGYVATGIKLQKRGYTCKYMNKPLISGFFASDIVDNMNEYKMEYTDILEACKREKIFSCKELDLKQKLNYLTYYITVSSPFRTMCKLILPLVHSILGIKIIEGNGYILALFWLVLYYCMNFCLLHMSNRTISLKWMNIYRVSMAPFLLIPGIVAVFKKYTIKNNSKTKVRKILFFIPHVVLIILNIVGVIKLLEVFIVYKDVQQLVIMVWLLADLYYGLMAVFWLIGRPYVRQEDRIDAHISYEMSDYVQVVYGMTRDLSSRGISVWCDKPYNIDEEETVNIKLNNGRYQANMEGNVIGVEYDGHRWKYVILFKNMESFKQQYYGILYDRMPQETSIIKSPQNIFSDIKRNICSRIAHKNFEYRRMARIPINRDVRTIEGRTVRVKNYNYKYVLIYELNKPKDELAIIPVGGIQLKCKKCRQFGEHTYMYKVLNYEELRKDKDTRELLYDWVEQCMESVNNRGNDEDTYKKIKNNCEKKTEINRMMKIFVKESKIF